MIKMLKSYLEEINTSISEAMEKDSKIFLIGEDIGHYGGAFGVTKGLIKKFGNKRIIDAPMSEQAIVGLGIGAALSGLKPIVELMFGDFVTLAQDQLFNHAGIFSYLTNGECSVPMVIRIPTGAGRGYGATHSKTLIAPLMQIPGIKIVAPSNAREIKGLLNASIKDKNPVMFIENKSLYGIKEEISQPEEMIPIGKGKVVREGTNLTIITYGRQVRECVEIANKITGDVNIEVIDLRTIKPIDISLIKTSIEKTKRAIIVDEGYLECGVASEIIAKINETCFYSLEAPIIRVNSLDVPIPCAAELENQIIPSKERIIKAIKNIFSE